MLNKIINLLKETYADRTRYLAFLIGSEPQYPRITKASILEVKTVKLNQKAVAYNSQYKTRMKTF